MKNADKRECSDKENEAQPLLDHALLDEFFSIIASIAVRLTKDDDRYNNGDDSTSPEVKQ